MCVNYRDLPDFVVRKITKLCDEIGKEEAAYLEYAVGCGVPIVASAHGGSPEELLQRRGVSALLRDGIFPYLYRVGAEGVERTEALCRERA